MGLNSTQCFNTLTC